jgi:hypothetical protein
VIRKSQLGPPNERDEDIQEAEFTEIEDGGQSVSSGGTVAPPRRKSGCINLGITSGIVVTLMTLAMCAADPSDGDSPPKNNNAVQTAHIPADAAETHADATEMTSVRSKSESELQTSTIPRMQMGEPYRIVRRRLLKNGFFPAHYSSRNCAPYGTGRGEECYDRPEIVQCAGRQPG